MKLDKVVYTAEVTSTGGRDGASKSSDGKIDFKIGKPKEMGGNDEGYNPEQLFAAGYSACFLGAIKAVASKENVNVPNDATVTARISFGPIPDAYGLAAELDVDLPGVERETAQMLIDKAHKVCPYSNATRGNIDVTIKLI